MIHYDDYNLQLIERAIRRYDNRGDRWRMKACWRCVRKC